MLLFSALLGRLLQERGISQREFARLAGVSHTFVNKILAETKRPGWQRSDTWADLLGLDGAEAEAFKDAMHVAAAPPRARALVARLASQLSTTKPTARKRRR